MKIFLFPCYFQELCERWGPQAHIHLWFCLELNRVTAHLSGNVVIVREREEEGAIKYICRAFCTHSRIAILKSVAF